MGVVVGCMMLGGAAVNTALVVARPDVYAALGSWFADVSPWDLGPLENLWARTFGEHPRVWGTVVGIGYEATTGAMAMSRNPRRRLAGLTGVALFKGGLLAMGLWVWAVPWLAVLAPTIAVAARSTTRAAGAPRGRPTPATTRRATP